MSGPVNMKHREKRRAPAVIGKFMVMLAVMALIEWARDDFTRTDASVMVGMAFGGLLVYFDPPTVFKYDIYTTPVPWKERISRFFK